MALSPSSKASLFPVLLRFCAVVGCLVAAFIAVTPATALGQTLSVGNMVFSDATGDGHYSPGEGVPSVRVELWRMTGDPENPKELSDFQLTQPNGSYLFTGVQPGDYVVMIPPSEFAPEKPLHRQISLPGSQLVGDDDTGEDGEDSFDPALLGVSTIPFSLVAGQAPVSSAESGFAGNSDDAADGDADLTIDFGFFHPLGMGNTVFADMNGNGKADPGEGIRGVVVQLYHGNDDPQATFPLADVVTGIGGTFMFGGLLPGDYKIHVPASQFSAGGILEGATSVIGVGQPQDDDDVLSGGDNGLDDAAPSVHGISSDVVTLAAGGAPTFATGETGNAEGDDIDDDANYDLTIDFGFVFPADKMGVGNVVFLDLNANGLFDQQEGEGVEGVQVMLFAQGANPAVDNPIAVRTTNVDGVYFFGAVDPGTYFVHIPKTEFVPGKPLFSAISIPDGDPGDDNVGEDGMNDPYPEETGISTPDFTLVLHQAPGQFGSEAGGFADSDDFRDDMVDLTQDFGFLRRATNPVTIGNLVFRDLNINGKHDAGESGIAGVQVKLFHFGANVATDAPIASTVTGPDGTYLFTQLTPGEFIVHVPASEFGSGKALEGLQSSPGNGGDVQDDDDTDENGIDSASPAVSGVSSTKITLAEDLEPLELGYAADADDSDDNNGDLTVDFGFASDCPVLAVSPASIPSATQHTNLSVLFTLTGSQGAVTWTLASGTLPPGVSLTLGALNGAPTVVGTYTFEIKGAQADGCFATQSYTVQVQPAANLGVGNLVFNDANGNGYFDAGEGVANVQVKLFASGADPSISSALQSTITSALGLYRFEGLTPGNYFVHVPAAEFQPGGHLINKVSVPGAGKDSGIDDDVNEDGVDVVAPEVTGVSSISFTLNETTEPVNASGETGADTSYDDARDANFDSTIDLGFVDSPSVSVGLGNLVFRDDNNNQVYDEGEGIDGVTVQLFNATDDQAVAIPLRTATTANGGRYLFSSLAPGNYKAFIPATQFSRNSALYGCISLAGAGNDGEADDNTDENGIDSATPGSTGIVSTVVQLALGTEPVDAVEEKGGGKTDDNLADSNTDLTLDFGFVRDCHTITVVPSSIPQGLVGTAMSIQLQGTGGVAPYTYAFAYGQLPPGLVLGSDGVVSGTPTNVGSYVFAVEVRDDFGCFVVKEYILTVAANPLGVGNMVFFDRDADGRDDPGEGIDGVTVELFLSTQYPDIDAPLASTITSGGGRYFIDNLPPGNYRIHIPKESFGQNGLLWKMVSSPGVATNTDDDSAEDGEDPLDVTVSGVTTPTFVLSPGACPSGSAESGTDGSSDDARDGDIDLTRDFGFVDATAVPASFSAWQTEHPGVGGPSVNSDGDGMNNLLEYALGGDPSTGARTGTTEAFTVVENQTSGQMSVQLRRRHGGQADITYTLEVIADIGSSPAGWVPTQLVPTVTNNGDGTETLTFGPLESDPALPTGVQTGFVRVHVSLDENHDEVPEASSDTQVLGWLKRTLQVRTQTYSVPFVRSEVFSGLVDSVGASSVSVGASIGSVQVSTLFTAGFEYYLEVVDGDEEGQRWEVDEASSTGSTIVLLPSHVRSTSSALLPALAGDTVALRPHWRVVDLFPPSDFHPATSPATSDNLLFWDNATTSYTTLWLVSVGGARWLRQGGGATVYDSMVLGPCDGLFTRPRDMTVNAAAAGTARTWKVACPLKPGYNFIGNPYPVSQSALERFMTSANGFTGSATSGSSDRVLSWTGDQTSVTGYETYYLVKGGSVERWLKVGGGGADQGNTKIFNVNTAVFSISILGQPNWVLNPTWNP
ncbi:MAG: hypothetical protein JNM99_01985 [Verrucomicrobiaceae bacterium]|nr:hypothetical protein [Verrucomicrobiaceae bacterium]